MIKHMLANWKTTSAGIIMIAGSIIHLVFSIRAGSDNENTWTIAVTAIVGGVGLLLAGDAGQSVQKNEVQTDAGTGFMKQNKPPDGQPFIKPKE